MEILKPNEKPGQMEAIGSLLLFPLSAAAAIWWGPRLTLVLSAAGILLAGVALLRAVRFSSYAKPTGVPLTALGLHGVMIAVGLFLWFFFLAPLPVSALRMPHLDHTYVDPDGRFQMRGPAGWSYERLAATGQVGVRLQPKDRNAYMGVSDVSVFIRPLDAVPKDPERLVQELALSLGRTTERKGTIFHFQTAPAELLDGRRGVWSRLDLKRFWIPLRQDALYGIKSQRYLCSVSAAGLAGHGRLGRILCLGLFESLIIPAKTPQETLKTSGNSG